MKDIAPQTFRRGFTLIEVLVATSLFAIVMTMSVGALVSVLEANRKARSLQVAINDLDFAIESIASRAAAFGTSYDCGDLDDESLNCPLGESEIHLVNFGGDTKRYWLQMDAASGRNRIYSQTIQPTTGPELPITSSDLEIESLTFHVIGGGTSDNIQPKVTMVVKGFAGGKPTTQTRFSIETTVSQRLPDLP